MGETWQVSAGNTVKTGFRSNNASDAVRYWQVDAANNITSPAAYAGGELTVTQTTDENGNISLEFKDKSGNLVLKRAQKDAGTWVETYYVFDKFNNLRLIIPPEATDELATLPSPNTWQLNQPAQNSSRTIQDLWCTYFRYDGLNRLAAKKIPEADSIITVYDPLGRVLLSQDGNLRNNNNNKWLFSKYDISGRAIFTGIYTHGSLQSQIQMQGIVDNHFNTGGSYYESLSGNPFDNADHGYTHNNAFPTDTNPPTYEVLTVTYYDDYAFLGANTGYDFNSEFDDGTTENKKFDRLRNRVTGSKVNATLAQALNLFVGSNVTYNSHPQAAGAYYYQGDGITLGDGFATVAGQTVHIGRDIVVPPSQEQTYWYLSASYYNRYGNVIQTIGDNHLGGLDKATSKYNFAGWVLEDKLEHTTSYDTTTIRHFFDYDHAGRILEVKQQIDNDPQVVLAANSYNELAQVVQKNLHSSDNGVTFVQSVDYTYNIRGWLTKMNDPNKPGQRPLCPGVEVRPGQHRGQ